MPWGRLLLRNSAKFWIMIAVAVIGGVLAYRYTHVSGTWRYRLTVTIETPEGLVSGSSVHEVSNSASRKKTNWPGGNRADFKGEAVIVDLGKRGRLFAILEDDPEYLFYRAFPVSGAATYEGIKYFNSLKVGEVAALPINAYPSMVTFKDLKIPSSIQPVLVLIQNRFKREITFDDVEKVFGEGVKIKSVTAEMTNNEVTWGIEKWLPWVPERGRIAKILIPPNEMSKRQTGLDLTVINFSQGKF